MKLVISYTIIFCILTSISCNNDYRYIKYYETYQAAVLNHDRNEMLSLLDKLNTLEYNNFQIFKLHILALSSVGDYEQITRLIQTSYNYSKNFEYWVLNGMIQEKEKKSGNEFFSIALRMIKEQEETRILELYLHLLTEFSIETDLSILSKEEQEIVEYYISLDREGLLEESPFNLLFYKPLFSQPLFKGENWWQ